METVFIHTNNKQGLGARLARFAIERNLPSGSPIKVEILNVDERPEFKAFAGKEYLRAGKVISYDPNDLQSFTLSRFMPPELMGYEGRSIVIDPDIFALADITPLMNMDLGGSGVAACKKKDAYDTSVMVMDNPKLSHWSMQGILDTLTRKEADYLDFTQLRMETSVIELSRDWNSLDAITPTTKMVHMTNRLTQPWKTGLPIDFTINKMPKIFGIIPREPVHKLLGKYPTHYQKHPDKNIEHFFIGLARDAYKAGALTDDMVKDAIAKKYVRADLLKLVKQSA